MARLAEQARAARTKLATTQARAISAERAAIAARANAVRAREQASYLAEVSAMLASTTDLEAVLEQMAWLAVPRLGDWCQLHLQRPNGDTRHHTIAHSDPATPPPWPDSPTAAPSTSPAPTRPSCTRLPRGPTIWSCSPPSGSGRRWWCRWPAGPGSLASSPSAATSQAAEGVEHGHGG